MLLSETNNACIANREQQLHSCCHMHMNSDRNITLVSEQSMISRWPDTSALCSSKCAEVFAVNCVVNIAMMATCSYTYRLWGVNMITKHCSQAPYILM